MQQPLSHARLIERIKYDPTTGKFIWRHSGNKAGCVAKHGYLVIRIDGVLYYAHRLAIFYVDGVWPRVVDHLNRDRLDNRRKNLRAADHAINQQNVATVKPTNKSGFRGVQANGSGWQAFIWSGGKRKMLGTFKTPELAHEAYLNAKRSMHAGYVGMLITSPDSGAQLGACIV